MQVIYYGEYGSSQDYVSFIATVFVQIENPLCGRESSLSLYWSKLCIYVMLDM